MFKFMVYLKSKKEREKLQMQMTKQEIMNTIKECENTLLNLREMAKNIKDDLNELSYKDLMKVYFDNEQFYDVRTKEQKELHNEWQMAYAKFKTLRDKRDETVKQIIRNQVLRLEGKNPNPNIYVITVEAIAKLVFEEIQTIYLNITPFDCEGDKYKDFKQFTYNGCSLTSWGNRINLLVHNYACRDIGGKYHTINKENVIGLRK